MKYIIKEQDIKKIVFKYFDYLFESEWEFIDNNDGEFTISNSTQGYIIKFRIISTGHLSSFDIYIFNSAFIKTVEDFFKISSDIIANFLTDWLNKKFDLQVEDWEWDAEDYGKEEEFFYDED